MVQLVNYFSDVYNALEFVAFIFGLAQVLLALFNKTINFYAGIISVSLYTIVFFHYGLFAESLLNLYYFIISIWGIIHWQKKQNRKELLITQATKLEWTQTILLLCISFFILSLVLFRFTSSNVPILDALVTAFAWAGTWLLLRRKIENWIVLNISNAIAIPLQLYKGMQLTSLLTLLYFVIAILGYLKWKKLMNSISSTSTI